MLVSMRLLEHYTIAATDGTIGRVCDSLFDDQAWVIRYLVVDTGSWLASREVLVSPFAIDTPDNVHKSLPVRITRHQVQNSPDIDTRPTVSRQHEVEYARYYGYPFYWGGNSLWGDNLNLPSQADVACAAASDATRTDAHALRPHDPHLRSATEVSGYHIHAQDGDLGHVIDMLIEEESWAIRYLVVATSNWWGGNRVLIPPQWIASIHWEDKAVNLNLTRAKVQGAPAFESCAALNRQQELDFYLHYARPNYWD